MTDQDDALYGAAAGGGKFDPLWDDWLRIREQRDALLAACEAALLHLNEAPLEYESGVTDPTGTIDEGNIVGWRTHNALVAELGVAIALVTKEA